MSKNIVESLYRTTLNEMSLGEMSLQSPARVIKSHISYSNKYSISDVENITSKAFEHVYGEDKNSLRYSRAIKSISDILLSDFEADFEEYVNIDIEDSDNEQEFDKEFMSHYYKYVIIFKKFYDDCTVECKGTDKVRDKDYLVLRNSARYAYTNLDNGIKEFIKTDYPEYSYLLNFYK